MFLADTNVLLYSVNDEAPEHTRCRALLDSWRSSAGPWFLTWPILYEFLRVMSHPKVLRKPWPARRALGFVQALLASPNLDVLVPGERHEALLVETVGAVPGIHGSFFHDLHTAVLMREHGIRRIVTRDAGFRRFAFLEVVDPLELES